MFRSFLIAMITVAVPSASWLYAADDATALAIGAVSKESGKNNVKDSDPPKVAPIVLPRQGKSETITLFNGKDLDGWEGHEKYWSVKDGEIVAKNTKRVKVSTYLLTKRNITDFRLRLAVKLVEGDRHSGLAFWGRTAPEQRDKYAYAGHLVIFPVEFGMYDLYGRKSLPVDPKPALKVAKEHDWNNVEILAQGNRVRMVLNGALVVDWRDPEPDRIKEGPIGLQLHSHTVPQEIRYKDLILTTFPEDKLETMKENLLAK
jgi:hypothetical protein